MNNKNKILNQFFIISCISFWPLINFISININENLISPRILIFSIIIFIFSIIFFYFLKLFLNIKLSLILVSISTLSFFLFGGFEDLFINLTGSINNTGKIALVSCLFTFVILTTTLILLTRRYNYFLVIYCFIFFLYFPSSLRLINNLNQESLVSSEDDISLIKIEKKVAFKSFHNVYYIILDQYARHDVLNDYLNIDNTNFLKRLKNRKFLINENSLSNYNRTGLSLSTVFNMDYYTNVNSYNNYLITKDSKTHQIFKSNKYDFVFAQSGGNTEISCSGKEDYCIKFGNFEEDIALFIKMTPLWRIMNSQYLNIYRYFESLYVLTDIDHAIESTLRYFKNKPKNYFFFAHILSPHEPQRFNQDCSKYFDINPELGEPSYKQYKVDLPCLNKQIIRTVDNILLNDQTDPIILIQSDHGISHNMDGIDSDNKLIRLKNLMTFRLPKKCIKFYYDEISPVNNMHLIFSCLSGKEPNYVPDRYFFANKNKFELEEVTGYL